MSVQGDKKNRLPKESAFPYIHPKNGISIAPSIIIPASASISILIHVFFCGPLLILITS